MKPGFPGRSSRGGEPGRPASGNPERARLEAHGIRPLKRRGQNFLLDPAVPREIVRRAGWTDDAPVVEIGPGGGALTDALLGGGRRVVAVEIDPDLVTLLEERFAPEIAEGRLTLIEADALDVSLAEVAGAPVAGAGGRPWLAGNLPYMITTPLLLAALRAAAAFDGGVFMVQREYGERILARPGEKAYGSLTVRVAAVAVARSVLSVGRSAFWARPGVESMVVEFRFPQPPPLCGDVGRLERILRAAFGQRRKTLENAIAHGLDLGKEETRAWLIGAGCDPTARAETLDLARFAALAESIPERPAGPRDPA